MNLNDILTWEGVKALATCEVLTPPAKNLLIAHADPARPSMKIGDDHIWFKTARKMDPAPGEIVYARTAWRHPWRPLLVKDIKVPVVLLTAFHDLHVKSQAVCEMFRPGSSIAHWFGVQAQTTHPRFTAMPIGVEGSMVPYLKAAERQDDHRETILYLNFQVGAPARPPHVEAERWLLLSQFKDVPWAKIDRWQKDGHAHYAAELGRSRFVLSPPGFGVDCYRTYEAIAMGAIPIVRRDPPMTNVCEHLPVLMVDDWNDITLERLNNVWRTRRNWRPPTATLTMSYWADQIKAKARTLEQVPA